MLLPFMWLVVEQTLTSYVHHPPFPSGITEWEAVLPSFNIFSDGPVCSAHADRLEPLSLPHLPVQNLFCPQPALPLLPVSIHP